MSRIYTGGFEFASASDNGILSLGSEINISSINPRKSAGGNGGVRCLEANTTGVNLAVFQPLPHVLSESYVRIYFRIGSQPGTHEYIFYDNGGASELFKLRFSGTSGPFILSVNGVDKVTGTATFILNTYYSMKIYNLIAVGGSITVDIDGVNDITFAGATNGGGAGWDQLRLNTSGRVFYDDFAINDTYTRVNYDSGNGVIPTGTLTGSGPGTATILRHTGDGTTGFVITDTTSGTFADNDTLTDTGTFAGVVNGSEDATSTGALKDGFVELYYPDGNGTTSNLRNSDNTQVNNFSYVNSFEDTSTYVYDQAGGVGDTYAMGNIPAEAIGINHVDAYFFCKRDGTTVNNIRSGLRIGGTNYQSYTEPITATNSWVQFSYQENPGTQAPWTISDIDAVESGPKLEP